MAAYGPLTYQDALDAACRLMTGYKSGAELVQDLTKHNGGYAPTLRDDDAAAPLPEHKAAIGLIREACDRHGFRWYDGSQLHNDPSARPRRRRDQLALAVA